MCMCACACACVRVLVRVCMRACVLCRFMSCAHDMTRSFLRHDSWNESCLTYQQVMEIRRSQMSSGCVCVCVCVCVRACVCVQDNMHMWRIYIYTEYAIRLADVGIKRASQVRRDSSIRET